jgi:SNF2 family DNA or RNA helicase
MLREEQIDIRRQRAKAGQFRIERQGKHRVFGDYRVTNPQSGGQYTVTIRGFDVGDNACSCPDYKSNTLGTCKHIEAVLDSLKEEVPPQFQRKKAEIKRPEILLSYGEKLQLALLLPARHSDKLAKLAQTYFDEKGFWSGRGQYPDLIRAIEEVPEAVTVSSDAMEFIDREIERAEMLAREHQWLQQLADGTFDQNWFSVPLYDYQIRGALFLACRGRSILGDDMGLGKTVQTLAAVELLARERNVQKVLVVAPASVKYQWETEIRKFTTRPVQVIDGSPEARLDQYAQPTFYRLVNYEQVVRDGEALNAWKPDVIILDEAQRIKNWEAKTSRAVKKLKSRYAMVLTGTPLENRLEELYSIVQFVDERRFGPAFQFLHDHRVLDENGNLQGYRNLEQIREKLAPIFLRRTRSEVLTQLPERTDNTVYVELADEQRHCYEQQRITLARLLQKNYLTDLDRKRILACVANLRMICDSLFLYDQNSRVSPKLEEFAELIPGLVAEHKLVVFSQWETMIHETAKVLEAGGVGYAILHGGLSGKERKAVLEQFLRDPQCRVFLSTDAGGTGLNLQVADTVVNLELPWNPAVLNQRIARVHRMGQSRPVQVINFVTRGTIEEKVLRTIEAKHDLFTGFFDGDADEIPFAAVNTTGFLATMRELVGPEVDAPPAIPESTRSAPAVVHPRAESASAAAAPAETGVWAGIIQIVEGACAILAQSAAPGAIPREIRSRLRTALATLSAVIDTPRRVSADAASSAVPLPAAPEDALERQ